jgi:chromosomal replication initiation ATPase DnaA
MEKCLAGSGGRPLRLTVRDIVSPVCLAYNLNESALKSKSQQRTLSEARAMAGWLAYESGCVTLTEVGR